MDSLSKSILFSSIAAGILLYSLHAQGAEPSSPIPGTYRPTGEFPSQGNQQFAPSSRRSPQAGAYQTFPSRDNQYPSAYGTFPYATGSNTVPYGYPADSLPGNIAPTYDPSPPAIMPKWSSQPYHPPGSPVYGQQPTTPAPRPFANPAEAENTFMQRPDNPGFGRNDSRFRPPELKGTP